MAEVKVELTVNDKKRDCTACRKTLLPGEAVFKTFTAKGKPAGYFCTQAGMQIRSMTMAELGYWDPVFLNPCPPVFDRKYLPYSDAAIPVPATHEVSLDG